MVGMQCNVELGNQLSICSGTKENHGCRTVSTELLPSNVRRGHTGDFITYLSRFQNREIT
jgi:hypothetical protein